VTGARRGIPFVVAAPSGTGKTTVCRRLVEEDPLLEFSVSHTTRRPRSGEREGVDYHFVSEARFAELVRQGAFLEWAEYNQNRYGTSWRALEEPLAHGHDVVLEIEVQGAAQVRERRADARFLFLLPPSFEVLERRLRARGTDDPQQVAERLALARRELESALRFDYAVVNDDLARCLAELHEIVGAERAGRAAELRRRFEPRAALARLPSAGGAAAPP
jgi:guanylate kinase